jgi:hypothetical protein
LEVLLFHLDAAHLKLPALLAQLPHDEENVYYPPSSKLMALYCSTNMWEATEFIAAGFIFMTEVW